MNDLIQIEKLREELLVAIASSDAKAKKLHEIDLLVDGYVDGAPDGVECAG